MIEGQAFESAGKPSWNGVKSLDFFECVLEHFQQPLVVGSCPDDGMKVIIRLCVLRIIIFMGMLFKENCAFLHFIVIFLSHVRQGFSDRQPFQNALDAIVILDVFFIHFRNTQARMWNNLHKSDTFQISYRLPDRRFTHGIFGRQVRFFQSLPWFVAATNNGLFDIFRNGFPNLSSV